MDHKKIRAFGAGILAAAWLILTGFAWFLPDRAASEAERRPLAQMPVLSPDTLLTGKFMSAFESYTQDQFPLRDRFRTLKSLFHAYVLGQRDNNDIYIADGYAAALDFPLDTQSVANAVEKFQFLKDKYLEGSKIYMAVVPDKSYYLAEPNGYPAMDYEAMFSLIREGMPWAEHIDLTDRLTIADYYRTDTHWRQEKLLPVAQKLAHAMGLTVPKPEDFTATRVDRPFYGVYYGQAALPLPAEELYVMDSPLLAQCKVFVHEWDKYAQVYDKTQLESKDLYDIFLSGSRSLLTIENPNGAADRELIVFRDSFGSSLVPLLVQDYKTVTVVDIRYLSSALLDRFVEFSGQDVLFLYSTLVLNNSATLK